MAFCLASSFKVASVMNRASTSKKSRRAARVSLRPKPSVPSETNGRGIQREIESGKART